MDPLERYMMDITRRQFFRRSASTLSTFLGTSALGSLIAQNAGAGMAEAVGAAPLAAGAGPADTLAGGMSHFAPKAKRVIYMHMEGAPSQLDLYDYKPQLRDRFDEDLPDSIRDGQRLTGMTSGQARFPVAPSIFKFEKYPNQQDGIWLSELLPHTSSLSNDMCLVRSVHTEAINHEPAITFFQTGHQQPGRPSFGAWTSYGLGSANRDLPTFVVLITQGLGNMQALSERFWGSGFLPSNHQGCRMRGGTEPVLYLNNPPGVSRADRRRMLDLLGELNESESKRTLDPEIAARLEQHEMAYRMQMSVPELTDFKDETKETLDLYGEDVHKPGSFAANCLLARRLAERGVRFIQLYMRGWDAHNNLPKEIRDQCGAVDQAQAALVKDLKRRGLLDDTLVIWGGEFGRTVYSQGNLTSTNYGRDHHPRCFSVWMAGGGVNPGTVYGKTDDYSYNIAENPVSVHDLHATFLHLLGFDHERLTYRHQARDFRLTDVFGKVVKSLIT